MPQPLLSAWSLLQGRYIVALKETVDHKFVTDLLQKRFPEYEIYTGKTGPCVDLIDISRVCNAPPLRSAAEPCPRAWAESACIWLQITKELGMSMYQLEETIIDMAVSLIQLGIATPKLKPGF